MIFFKGYLASCAFSSLELKAKTAIRDIDYETGHVHYLRTCLIVPSGLLSLLLLSLIRTIENVQIDLQPRSEDSKTVSRGGWGEVVLSFSSHLFVIFFKGYLLASCAFSSLELKAKTAIRDCL